MISFLLAQVEDPSDCEFLTEIFHSFHRLLFSVAQEYFKDQYIKEEIVQDSFVKIIENIETIRKINRYALPFYLVIIVRRTAINHLRHMGIVNNHVFLTEENDHFVDISDPKLTMDEYVVLLEHRDMIDRIWPRLSETDRYVLEAFYFAELSAVEIAKTLGCTPEAVRMKLSRARKRAREELLKEDMITYE